MILTFVSREMNRADFSTRRIADRNCMNHNVENHGTLYSTIYIYNWNTILYLIS